MSKDEQHLFTLEDVYDIHNASYAALVALLSSKGYISFVELAQALRDQIGDDASPSVAMHLSGLAEVLAEQG